MALDVPRGRGYLIQSNATGFLCNSQSPKKSITFSPWQGNIIHFLVLLQCADYYFIVYPRLLLLLQLILVLYPCSTLWLCSIRPPMFLKAPYVTTQTLLKEHINKTEMDTHLLGRKSFLSASGFHWHIKSSAFILRSFELRISFS